jgi:hypothetical protein
MASPFPSGIIERARTMMARICKNVSIALPQGCDQLRPNILELIPEYFPTHVPELSDQSDDLEDFDAILSIGREARADLPWTAINSDGWIARVSSGGKGLIRALNININVMLIGCGAMGTVRQSRPSSTAAGRLS